MRYGVIADVHGNLDALRPVLRAIDREGVDGYLVAGDLVGYGPHPNECVAAVAELGATCVAGNHDLIVLGILSDDRCIELARQTLRWTRQILGADERAFLAALPRVATAPGGVRVAHGALDDPRQYTTSAGQALAQLDRLDDGDRASCSGTPTGRLRTPGGAGRLPTRGATALPPQRGRATESRCGRPVAGAARARPLCHPRPRRVAGAVRRDGVRRRRMPRRAAARRAAAALLSSASVAPACGGPGPARATAQLALTAAISSAYQRFSRAVRSTSLLCHRMPRHPR